MAKNFGIKLFCLWLIVSSASFSCSTDPPDVDFLQRARQVNGRILLLDSHVDILLDYATGWSASRASPDWRVSQKSLIIETGR